MYNFLAKNGQLLAFGLGALITVVFLISVFSGLDSFLALSKEEQGTTGIFNFGLVATILLAIAGLVFAIFFGLFQTISNPRGSIYGIGAIVLLLVIFFVARAMGSDDGPIMKTINAFNVTDGQSSFITGAISTGLILALLALLALALSEIRNFFK